MYNFQCVVDFDCPRVARWGNATTNAIRNLERLVDSNSITDQFSLALVSYALAEANSSRAVTVFGRLEALARNEGTGCCLSLFYRTCSRGHSRGHVLEDIL